MSLTAYQKQRLQDVQSWYQDIYRSLDGYAPVSVQYMALWAVFNALYNIADLPKVKLRSVSTDDERIKPYMRGRNEDKKIRFVARQLSQDADFVTLVMQGNKEFIEYLAERLPEVEQPSGTEEIQFEFEKKTYIIDLNELHGLGSLDNRIILANGEVLFQYYSLDLDLDQDGIPTNSQNFLLQLIFMLYQLRNNIVHGGAAAFFSHKTELTIGAMQLLQSICRYLFDHPNLLEQEA
jgi:hypothetical protein